MFKIFKNSILYILLPSPTLQFTLLKITGDDLKAQKKKKDFEDTADLL